MNWIAKYQTVPFEKLGHDFNGFNCWGLVHLIYKTELNIELPTYGETSATNLIKVARDFHNGYNGENWVSVERKNLRVFDVVVMRLASTSRIGHCGVFVGGNKILHTEAASGVAIVDFSHHTIRERIAAFRRHKARLNDPAK